MRGLKVLPSGRPGRGRLYVNLPDGQAVAWYDRQANRISVLADDHREAILAALRPYLSGTVAIGPPPVPAAADLRRLAMPPDADLAPNRPAEALLGELEHGAAGTRARHRLRQDLTAQQRMGDAFDALEPDGWRTLHCVPLPGFGRIDHLVIGPAGIFCVRTVPGRRQRAVVGDLLLTIGRAEPRPDPRWIRGAAARAAALLAAKVTPALAVVDASRLETAPTVRDIRILQPPTATPDLLASPAALKPPDVEALFAQARDTRTWLPPTPNHHPGRPNHHPGRPGPHPGRPHPGRPRHTR
ncbi:nuclease-related domain-containing protein [Streptomyces sp. NRRL S-378]|uniref:nuclease-related domain-containing protein n=1 Tax=Streptomyces sp. NRRL S-378 TaxID=1463904 RepID=UPI0007C54937|nr:nuclease-related domain-containing protein [Streptomyces sp. NRRL S-378]